MRAVNLIPNDLRRAGGSPGASGNGVYVFLGVLGVALVLVAAWAVAGRSVAKAENDLARVKAEANAADVRAGQLTPYAKFHEMRTKRVETVTSLSRSRFNWPFALREISRVLPEEVWLTQVLGTVAPGVQVEDAGGGPATTLRNSVASPALEITGCTETQEDVARYLARLRSIQGVTRVTLAQSEKADILESRGSSGGGGGGNSAGGDIDCRQGNRRIPKFELIIFFEASTATASTGPAGGPAATTQPASSTKGASK